MKISQIQQNEKIEIKMPKSFLVTALEPSVNVWVLGVRLRRNFTL